MVKRRLSLLMLALMSGQTAMGAEELFGQRLLTRVSHTQCADQCVPGCGDESCCDPTADLCGESCGDGCGEGCGDDCGALFGSGGIGSLLKKSDHCFDEFISPMTNPVFFEDPRTLTEARFIYINHQVPPALGGNNVQLFALQLRAALTDELSLIATKDGFIISDNPLINDGWADLAAGLKLNVYRNVCTQTIASVGATYELPSGTNRALQGNGDGEFHLFATGGKEILDDTHWISGAGWRLPVDQGAEATSVYWSNHLDRRLGDSGLYVLGECNWFHWTADGANAIPVAGHDLFNLGPNAIDNESLVTGALGVKYKPSGNTELGVAW